MKRNLSVYYVNSESDLENYYNSDNINLKIDVIDYLRLTDKIDLSYEKLKECYEISNLTQKQINRMDFIQYLYFIYKKDNYNSKKLKRKLKNNHFYNDDFLFDFCEAKTFEEQINLFDNYINNENDIKKLHKNKLLKNNIEYLYLENLNRNNKIDIISSKYIEKKIRKHLIKIIKKKKINILEVMYLWQIMRLIQNHYVEIMFINNSLFIDNKLLSNILNKLTKFIPYYFNVFPAKQIIDFNETIVSTYKLLGMVNNLSNEDFIKNQELCIKFIDDNKEFLKPYTIFLNTIFKRGKINKTEIIENITDILNNKATGEIMFLVFLGASYLDINDYKNYIEELEGIKYEISEVEKYNIQNFEFAIRMLKFWEGESFDLSFLEDNMYIDPFLKSCIEYDNDLIDYSQFISQIDEIKSISSSMILNWERLEKIFKKTNSIEWFKKLISKMNNLDLMTPTLQSYLIRFYTRISNNKEFMLMNTFVEMDNFIRRNFDNIVYLYYSITININIYNNYDDNVKEEILTIIERFDELEKTIKGKIFITNFVYLLVFLNLEIEDKDITYMLFELLTTNKLLKENNILLYGLVYDKPSLLTKYYDAIFETMLDIYNAKKNIKKNDYMLIAQISQKSLGQKVKIINIEKNKYYYNDNRKYILKAEYNENLKELYKELGINVVDSISEPVDDDNILQILTDRIFFSNIEKMKVGKIIRAPENVTGEEFLKILSKETGFEEVRKDLNSIRTGQITNCVWFNTYNIHSYFKDIELLNNSVFANSKNELIKIDKCLFHISSLIFAVKLGLSDILLNDNRIYITSSVYEELMYQKSLEITELTDGILEPKINYDDLFESCCNLVEILNEKGQIIEITKANILGTRNLNSINKFDRDVFKFFVSDIGESNKYFVITEDPFYYKINGFNTRSFSIYSYIVEKYISSNIIDSERLLDITNKLILCKYGFNLSKNLFAFLLEKSDDHNIREIVEKLKEYVI